MSPGTIRACLTVLILSTLHTARAQSFSAIDAAFQKFWNAGSPIEAERIAGEIVGAGISFEETEARLKNGRTYPARGAGVAMSSNRTEDGIEHYYAVTVPKDYDPTQRYPVRFQLHGGVEGRTGNQPGGTGEIGGLAGGEQFYVLPYAWKEAPWWSEDQILNLEAIVDALKRTYNIDENRVVLSGSSDGGTGAYYVAMRETTPFASFLPLIGFIGVLANDDIDDGNLYPNNMRNKPLFVINGGKDPLYPAAEASPFIQHLTANGVEIAYHVLPDAGHNTAWWPEMKDTFEKFVTDHPRDPHPDRLTWETADLAHNRAHWIIIDRFASPAAPQMRDINLISSSDPIAKSVHRSRLFSRPRLSGRVDVVRVGNTVEATTSGVGAFTLLISPEKFDFSRPVRVIANGREIVNARVDKSVETLMKWAARDNDRTMLYAAEVKVRLTPQ